MYIKSDTRQGIGKADNLPKRWGGGGGAGNDLKWGGWGEPLLSKS